VLASNRVFTRRLLSIWIAVKQTPFRQSVRALQSWIEKKETEIEEPKEQKANWREYNYDLKYVVLLSIFREEREKAKYTVSANKLKRWIKQVVSEQLIKEDYPELSSATEIRKLLKFWIEDCPVFFTVKETGRPEKHEYNYTIELSELQDAEKFLGSRYQNWV
jgi:hypothetical protein